MKTHLKPEWFKNRGYLHLSNQKDLKEERKLIDRIKSPKSIAQHAFFPLIHSIIKERRYKKVSIENNKRAHSHKEADGKVKKNYKNRPLHYATHIDAMIFGYYAEILLKAYETTLLDFSKVSESVIAYRKINIANSEKNKSTIHFANEVFNEIKDRAKTGKCCVLKFDIKSFFSRIDHEILKRAWAKVLALERLPPDHYNVFKATTRFSYIMLDDLRITKSKSGKKSPFDEKKLANHTKSGILAFFESPKELREKIENKEIKLHKYPFRNIDGEPVGIPQGLPISAVLANIYLFDFDSSIIKQIVEPFNCYYRRYSDDIIVLCEQSQADEILDLVNNLIQLSKVEISKEKTERFDFSVIDINAGQQRLTSIKSDCGANKIGIPFSYLGFEFYGYQTLIKSNNLAKFYRRMIYAVKSKSRRALQLSTNGLINKPVIHKRQLYKLYTSLPLNSTITLRNKKWLEKNVLGHYVRKTKQIEKKQRSNYISYVRRASEIMEEPKILRQIRNHIKILNQAIQRHLKPVE